MSAEPRAERRSPNVALRTTLVAAELFVGVGAVYGGAMLMSDAWRLPIEYLAPLPLQDWVLPGIALLLLVGGPMLAAAVLTARRHSGAANASTAAGLLLTGWVIVQLIIIGPRMVLQAVMLVLGVAITVLGWRLRQRMAPRRFHAGNSRMASQ